MLSYEEQRLRLEEQGLWRRLRTFERVRGVELESAGQTLINFASNDYLGLVQHPALKDAAQAALDEFGVGAGASRLISGSSRLHAELEAALARFKGVEAVLTFTSGYAAAVGTLPALFGPGDTIIVDKLVHASLIDGARLSGARIRVYPHNDLAKLEKLLNSSQEPERRTVVVTEAVFSMDGDVALLAEIVRLKSRYKALLLVDEAHSTGICGINGAGLVAELGLSDQVDIHLGTLSKACGVSGGFIGGSRSMIEFLINRARSFVFSTAPSPISVASAHAALRIIESEEGWELRQRLQTNIRQLALELARAPVPAAILPFSVGSERKAIALAEALFADGWFVPAIRYPTVARCAARLRLAVSAGHSAEQILGLAGAVRRAAAELTAAD